MKEYRRAHGDFKIRDSPFGDLSGVQRSATLKNSIVLENMAELDYIFTDKTGTLTKNQMSLKYIQDDALQTAFSSEKQRMSNLAHLIMLAICNTVERQENMITGESPDEMAFAAAAEIQDFKLIHRQAKNVKYDYQGDIYEFEIISVIPFTSLRKRMSIILREISPGLLPTFIAPKNQPFIVTKGADSFVLPRCVLSGKNTFLQHISDLYSQKGLRTLIFAHKPLDELATRAWARSFEKIAQLGEASPAFIQAIDYVEGELVADFVSAVEDELQTDVRIALSSFQAAGIKTWMLTGDKTETAMNIARAAGIAGRDTQFVQLTHGRLSEEDIVQSLDSILRQHSDNGEDLLQLANQIKTKFYLGRKQNLGLLPRHNINIVIDGEIFTHLTAI